MRKEIIVYVSGQDWCGSGGCTMLILVPHDSSYKMIGRTTIVWPPIRVLNSRTHGRNDISVWVEGGGIRPGYEALLPFDGKKYPSNPAVPPARRLRTKVAGHLLITRMDIGTSLYDSIGDGSPRGIIRKNTIGAQASSKSYWVLLRPPDGNVWCGFSGTTEFNAEADKLKPTESARVTYSSGKLTELTDQVDPESGDWIVIDKYTPSGNELLLRRANLLTQENLQVIQGAVIRDGKAEPFRVVSVTTLEGKKTKASTIDFPDVPVRTSLAKISFMAVVDEMRSRSASKVCKKSE